MNRIILILFLFGQAFVFSQEKRMSYYFDTVIIKNCKNYETGFKGKEITFLNQKDSTYNLQMRYNDSIKEAKLFDEKNRQFIKFKANFDYEKIEDLNKLTESKLYTRNVIIHKGKVYKKYVEDMEYEKDTINNKIIVHLTRFKNKKRKKIINENYYYFGKNNLVYTHQKSVKNYLISKYGLHFEEDENQEKIIHLEDGKITYEQEGLKIEYVDFNFVFNVDEINPKLFKINFN